MYARPVPAAFVLSKRIPLCQTFPVISSIFVRILFLSVLYQILPSLCASPSITTGDGDAVGVMVGVGVGSVVAFTNLTLPTRQVLFAVPADDRVMFSVEVPENSYIPSETHSDVLPVVAILLRNHSR